MQYTTKEIIHTLISIVKKKVQWLRAKTAVFILNYHISIADTTADESADFFAPLLQARQSASIDDTFIVKNAW